MQYSNNIFWNHYFTERCEQIQTEYARSGRSRCRGCDKKIEQGMLRIGIDTQTEINLGYLSLYWYHVDCVRRLPDKMIELPNIDIINIEFLESKDQKVVKDKIAQLQKKLKKKKKTKRRDLDLDADPDVIFLPEKKKKVILIQD